MIFDGIEELCKRKLRNESYISGKHEIPSIKWSEVQAIINTLPTTTTTTTTTTTPRPTISTIGYREMGRFHNDHRMTTPDYDYDYESESTLTPTLIIGITIITVTLSVIIAIARGSARRTDQETEDDNVLKRRREENLARQQQLSEFPRRYEPNWVPGPLEQSQSEIHHVPRVDELRSSPIPNAPPAYERPPTYEQALKATK